MKRNALFISHASPEDNAFTIWLGAKLASIGYEVWADVFRLRGGDDWQRKLERALREYSFKVLVVATPTSVDKQGVRNEIQIATDTAKEIGDKEFIIPLRLERFRSPFLIAHAQYIDFTQGWAKGFSDLLETLEEYKVPYEADETPPIWRDIQLIHAKSPVHVEERLISNWLRFNQFPEKIYIYDFKPGISLGRVKTTLRETSLPVMPFKRGFLSFAAFPSAQDAMGPQLPLMTVGSLETSAFISEGWADQAIRPGEARNFANHLLGAGIDQALLSKGFKYWELANGRRAWFLPRSIGPNGKVRFDWLEGIAGLRQIIGFSAKRNLWWHYGVSPQVVMWPEPHVKLRGRLIFAEDGENPISNPNRMHQLRRSFAKSWRNARWRDMMLALLWWLTNGEREIHIPYGADDEAVLLAVPILLPSPVSIADEAAEPADDDDPDESVLERMEDDLIDDDQTDGDEGSEA